MPSRLAPIYEMLCPPSGGATVLVIPSDSRLNPRLCGFLSKQERAGCNRYAHERDRRSAAAMRGLLRLGAGALLGEDPDRVELERDGLGRPRPAGLSRDEADLNVSRTSGCVALIVSRGGLCGVDVERVEPGIVSDELIAFLTRDAEESTRIRGNPALFFELWTRVESVLKGEGVGLSEGAGAAWRVEMGDRGVERWATRNHFWASLPTLTPPGVVGRSATTLDPARVEELSFARVESLWPGRSACALDDLREP